MQKGHTIEDQLARVSKRVSDLHKERAGLSGEGLSGRPAGTRQKEEVLRTSSADGVDNELDGVHPGGDVGDVVGLVHDAATIMRHGGVRPGE